jgi:hypothetical protein
MPRPARRPPVSPMGIHPAKLAAIEEAAAEAAAVRRRTLRQRLAAAGPSPAVRRVIALALAWSIGWGLIVAGLGIALDGVWPRRDLDVATWVAGAGLYCVALAGWAPLVEIARMGVAVHRPSEWLGGGEKATEVER